jgi:hypothetical protein
LQTSLLVRIALHETSETARANPREFSRLIRELFRRLSGEAGLQLYYPQIYKNGICTLP